MTPTPHTKHHWTAATLAAATLLAAAATTAQALPASPVDIDVDIDASQLDGTPGINPLIRILEFADNVDIPLPAGTDAIHFRFTEMEHIEITPGTAGFAVQLEYDDNNLMATHPQAGDMVHLTDMNGQIIFTHAQSGRGLSQWQGASPGPQQTFILHDILFEFGTPLPQATTLDNVSLSMNATGSGSLIEVGVWTPTVPEPITAALTLMSLATLATTTRRRTA